jgi:DNA-binding NarL/FixJ family response regulator
MSDEINIQEKLDTDEDFIDLKRFDYSIRKALERYPDGLPDKLIAQGLCVSEATLEQHYQAIVIKLRKKMKVVV